MTRHDSARPPVDVRRARRAFLVVAIGVPLALTAVAVGAILAMLPAFPSPVAVHWGLEGPDGFGPASTYLWVTLVIGLALPLFLALTTLAAVGTQWGGAARVLGAFASGLSAFAAAIGIGSLLVQRGIRDPAEAPGAGGVLAAAVIASLAVGILSWVVQPRVDAEPGRTLPPRRAVPVSPGERTVWIATTAMPAAALVVVLTAFTGVSALAVSLLVMGARTGWYAALCAAFVGVAAATMTVFRVRVTPEGFAARSSIGWPRITIPLADITAVRAVEVSPFGEFGGWGWRVAVDGRSGIVLRRGAAIEITRRSRRPFVVTIDGAEDAAALLQTYIDYRADRPRDPRQEGTAS
ncbi:hypothetical protein [Microbacterium sp. XT11]|uniref:hypothetical protein n=1 Tax=Microbacterium sp. XT11 TaxID=367477 RepID=UPI000742E3B8|nr:hypothetical protein [Microbacterium sp. XT11]ALX66570.1 hypothetical protein AB663_001812 [Microbacterium sp. XT11]